MAHHDDVYTSDELREELHSEREHFAKITRLAQRLSSRLNAVRLLAMKHNHPGVNVGAHALANKILRILDEPSS